MKHYSREQLGQFSDRLKEIVETKGTSVLEHRTWIQMELENSPDFDHRTVKLVLLAIDFGLAGYVQSYGYSLEQLIKLFSDENPCTDEDARFIVACFAELLGVELATLPPEQKSTVCHEAHCNGPAPSSERNIADATIARAMPAGLVCVREGCTTTTTFTNKSGIMLDSGYLSPYMTNSRDEKFAIYNTKTRKTFAPAYISQYSESQENAKYTNFRDPLVLTIHQRLTNIQIILPLLEQIVAENKSIVIFANEIDGDLLKTLVVNMQRSTFQSVAIRVPGNNVQSAELLKDIAVVTGGEYFDEHVDAMQIKASQLGSAEQVIVTDSETYILGGKGTRYEMDTRAATINEELLRTTSDVEKANAVKRLEMLQSQCIGIEVGATTVEAIASQTRSLINNLMRRKG